MIAPLNDGNAHGIYSSSEATVVNHNFPGKIKAHMDYFAQLPVTNAEV